ncbi:MAG: hypothetical protein DRI81_16330 [Chloroflexi bacterium]|nr:MAG: hypothetical protein DRI81_16330 [Chloroflexota bacterium]
MAKYNSKALEITYNSVAIEGSGSSLDVDETQGAEDVTSFGEDDGAYIAGGVTHRKASFNAFAEDDDTIYDELVPGTSSTLEWYPQGNSSGKPKKSVTAIVTSRKRSFGVGKAVLISSEFQLSGAVTDTVVA